MEFCQRFVKTKILIIFLYLQIIPFQFLDGQNADTLGLTGHETFDILIPDDIHPHHIVDVVTSSGIKFQVVTRFDTDVDVAYYRNGGILNFVVRKLIQ